MGKSTRFIDSSITRRKIIEIKNNISELKMDVTSLFSYIKKIISNEQNDYNDFKFPGDISVFRKFLNDQTNESWKKKDIVWLTYFESIINKIPEYIKEEMVITENKISKKNKTILKDYFFQSIKTKLQNKIFSSSPQDFFKENARKFRLSEDELNGHLIANPSVLFSLVSTDENQRKSEKDNVSKVYNFNTRIDTNLFSEKNENFDDYYNGGKNNIEDVKSFFSNTDITKGILLGHALSPYSESICLLYELGRFKRIAETHSPESFLKHKIFLTDVNWAMKNRSAVELFEEEIRREKLTNSLSYRQKLYNILNIDVDLSGAGDTRVNNKTISNSDIKKYAEEFSEYSNLIKSSIDNSQNNNESLLAFIENLSKDEYKQSFTKNLPKELKLLSYSIVEDKKNLFVIYTILKHFDSLDKETFHYTLLQRYKQQSYNGWLKIAVESEKKFDASFIKLDKFDGVSESNIGGMYFKHYYFTLGNDRKPLSVIPYTFPSGKLWKHAKSNCNLDYKEAINEAKKNAILLWDFENDRKIKIKKIINEIDLNQLAIQMCDLFSFCNYFFKDDETFWEGSYDSGGQEVAGLNFYLNLMDQESEQSWKKYRIDKNKLNQFSNFFLTIWYSELDLPYFFYPFLHIQDAKRDKEKEDIIRSTYSEIIIYILEQLNKKMRQQEW